jgi:hypothetical protein
MGETGADNGTDARADLHHVAVVREIAARAARRATRRSLIIAALADAAMIVMVGVVTTWVASGWLTWPFFSVVIYLTMRTASRAEKSGLVQAKPAMRVVLVTGGVTLTLVLALGLVMNPAVVSGLWCYVLAAAVALAVGLVSAWWAGR